MTGIATLLSLAYVGVGGVDVPQPSVVCDASGSAGGSRGYYPSPSISASAGCAGAGARNAPSGAAPAEPPACSWTPARYNTVQLGSGNDAVLAESGELPYFVDAHRKPITRPGPGDRVLHVVECPPGSGNAHFEYATLAAQVDRQALIDEAYAEARAAIPLPTLDISPAADVGVAAQLGVWLAVGDPGQVNALASVGPVWASVTAHVVATSWNMGNGDVVECAGLGTPYPEGSGVIEQGPCGYTYTRPGDAGVRTVTVTGRWEVRLVTSDGVDRLLDPVEASFSFEYEVYEIVTVVEGLDGAPR